MANVRTLLLPAHFHEAAVVGQTRIWCELQTTKEQKKKAEVQAIIFGVSSFTVNKSQNDLGHSNRGRAINSPIAQQKWPCWVWGEANLTRNSIFCYWVTERAKAHVWGSSVRSSSKSGKFVKWIVMTLDFWQPILSDFYSKPETSQAQKLSKRSDMKLFFSQN